MVLIRGALVLLALLAAACSETSISESSIAPEGESPESPDGGAAVACTATSAYGSPTAIEPFATREGATNPAGIFYAGSLNDDDAYDDLTIELVKGYGVYKTGEIVPTTVPLTGDEADFVTCGACVVLNTDVDRTSLAYTDAYMATGGTLTITSVSPRITGTLTNATFAHVTIDPDTYVTTVLDDGCTATVDSFTFDTVIETDGAAR